MISDIDSNNNSNRNSRKKDYMTRTQMAQKHRQRKTSNNEEAKTRKQ